VTENKSFVLTEEVSRARIAYVLKHYREEFERTTKDDCPTNNSSRIIKAKYKTVQNFLHHYANFNVVGDMHFVTYVQKKDAYDYRYCPKVSSLWYPSLSSKYFFSSSQST